MRPGSRGQGGAGHDPGHLVGLERRPTDEGTVDDRLGEDYGEYARRAAGAIENVANAIAEKNPDELIEDTRNFVRNSPGVALAGAAVVGFVVARLLKGGLARDEDDED